jgi:hypothetical protein
MSHSNPDRRRFIAGMAGGLAGAALVAHATALEAATRATPGASRHVSAWDDSWTTKLGRYRTAFDVADIDAERGPDMIGDVMDAYHEAMGTTDADLGFVLVLRHKAVPYFFSDALWAKYEIGKLKTEKDSETKAPYRRNPHREVVTALQKRGVVVLGCNRAVQGFVGRMATETKRPAEEVKRDVMDGLMPGVILQPNGLYAMARAQDVGCGFMR